MTVAEGIPITFPQPEVVVDLRRRCWKLHQCEIRRDR
jgi:hypothetical protein